MYCGIEPDEGDAAHVASADAEPLNAAAYQQPRCFAGCAADTAGNGATVHLGA